MNALIEGTGKLQTTRRLDLRAHFDYEVGKLSVYLDTIHDEATDSLSDSFFVYPIEWTREEIVHATKRIVEGLLNSIELDGRGYDKETVAYFTEKEKDEFSESVANE